MAITEGGRNTIDRRQMMRRHTARGSLATLVHEANLTVDDKKNVGCRSHHLPYTYSCEVSSGVLYRVLRFDPKPK